MGSTVAAQGTSAEIEGSEARTIVQTALSVICSFKEKADFTFKVAVVVVVEFALPVPDAFTIAS